MLYRTIFLLLFGFSLQATAIPAQTLQGIINSGDKLKKITGEMAFSNADALCWDNGMLLFADNNLESPEKSVTYRMAADGSVTPIRKNNGVTTAIAPSGKGTYYCCEFEGRRVIEMDSSGKVLRTVADKYKERPFDGPNDLVVDRKGGIYFTDARFEPGVEVTVITSAVYYLKPDGTILKVVESLLYPNGICLSPDGSILYVLTAHDQNAGQYVYSYRVNANGTLSKSEKFCELWLTVQNEAMALGNNLANFCICEMKDYTATSGAEGCAVDTNGNVYIATDQGIGIQVFSPAGQFLGSLTGFATRCCFGGSDLMTLYVSAKDGIYSIQTRISGMRVAIGK